MQQVPRIKGKGRFVWRPGLAQTLKPPQIIATGTEKEGRRTGKTRASVLYVHVAMKPPPSFTSSNMSRWPPENPRQLANTISGSPSWFRSWIAWAVLWALSGYQTPPALNRN